MRLDNYGCGSTYRAVISQGIDIQTILAFENVPLFVRQFQGGDITPHHSTPAAAHELLVELLIELLIELNECSPSNSVYSRQGQT